MKRKGGEQKGDACYGSCPYASDDFGITHKKICWWRFFLSSQRKRRAQLTNSEFSTVNGVERGRNSPAGRSCTLRPCRYDVLKEQYLKCQKKQLWFYDKAERNGVKITNYAEVVYRWPLCRRRQIEKSGLLFSRRKTRRCYSECFSTCSWMKSQFWPQTNHGISYQLFGELFQLWV